MQCAMYRLKNPRQKSNPTAPQLVITPDLLETLRVLLAQTTVSEEANNEQLFLSQGEQDANTSQEASATDEDEPGANNGERVKAYLCFIQTRKYGKSQKRYQLVSAPRTNG